MLSDITHLQIVIYPLFTKRGIAFIVSYLQLLVGCFHYWKETGEADLFNDLSAKGIKLIRGWLPLLRSAFEFPVFF